MRTAGPLGGEWPASDAFGFARNSHPDRLSGRPQLALASHLGESIFANLDRSAVPGLANPR